MNKIYVLSRDGNGQGGPRASAGRAGPGPENPGPRALRAQTGLKFFYLRVLCAVENSNFCQVFTKFIKNFLNFQIFLQNVSKVLL